MNFSIITGTSVTAKIYFNTISILTIQTWSSGEKTGACCKKISLEPTKKSEKSGLANIPEK